jgi:transcriptional regulator with XRE-family HTH domain
MTKKELGAWLKERRLASGLSLDRLGELVGRSRQQLSEYEKGTRDPSGTVLMRLLDALGIELVPPPPGEPGQSIETELRALRAELARVEEAATLNVEALLEALREGGALPQKQPPRPPSKARSVPAPT